MVTDRNAVVEALERRKAFILGNVETMTLKKLRALLEEDLGLERDALKPQKNVISEFVDTLMSQPAAHKETKSEDKEDQAEEESSDDSDNSDANGSQVDLEKKSRKSSGTKRKAATSAAPKAAPRVYTKKVERMRNLCKQATITIPPNVYSKNKSDKELEKAFEMLLHKNGLSADAGPNEVAKVKQKLILQRDLDGIDTSNIISAGRRRGAGLAAPRYRDMLKTGSDDDDEKEDEEAHTASSEDDEGGAEESIDAEEEDGDDTSPVKKPKASEECKKESPPHALNDIGNVGSDPITTKKAVVDWSDDDQ